MKAFILAAGIGSRLLPLTKNNPKAIIKIQGIPMIDLIIKRLIKYGYNHIIINLHHFGEKIEDHCKSQNNFGVHIDFIYEEKLLNTGGAVKNAAHLLLDTNPVLLHNVDALSDINLFDFLKNHHLNQAKVSLAVQNRKTDRYLLFDESNQRLVGWKNIKTNEIILQHIVKGKIVPMAFSGIHLLSQDVIKHIAQNKETVFSITKYYVEYCKQFNINGFYHNQSFFMDLGKHENLKFAEYLNLNKFL